LLGWQPNTGWDQSVSATVEWFLRGVAALVSAAGMNRIVELERLRSPHTLNGCPACRASSASLDSSAVARQCFSVQVAHAGGFSS
jgi:hypothetical protein